MSSPKIPKKESYWKKKGKREINGTYKNVMLYTHDDLDGIYSAIAIRNHLLKQGYSIIGYGLVNYQEGWDYITLHKDLINVSVDYAHNHNDIDIYIDHHGEQFNSNNKRYAIKTATCSAYEGILRQYGIPTISNVLEPIDMVDSARYGHYNINVTSTLHFDFNLFKNKLTFVGALNQLIKRSDIDTLIEVIHNTKECSIYEIYSNLKRFYGGNNLDKKFNRKDFVLDGISRIDQMKRRTRGTILKKVYTSQEHFMSDFYMDDRINLNGNGYQVLNNIAFIPTGTWCNPIRARAILQEDIEKGVIPNCIEYILLQYGNSLQIVAYDNTDIHLGKYMEDLVTYFKIKHGYVNNKTAINIDDDVTVSGGHKGIGTISQIFNMNIEGSIFDDDIDEVKYVDMFKNKIISDLSNMEWDLRLSWSSKEKKKYTYKEPIMDYSVIMTNNIRTCYKEKTKYEKAT